MTTLRIGLIQHCVSSNKTTTRQQMAAHIHHLAEQGAQLVVLPELHDTPYFCQTEEAKYCAWAETIPGPATDYYCSIARKEQVVLVISLFEKRAAGVYHNTAVVLESDGTIAGTYRKMHIPDDPTYYEKYYFTPGDKGFTPIATSVGHLGVQVCWDQWFPEGARIMALAGADILLFPTAIGFAKEESSDEQQRQHEAWQIIQRSHAIANGIPVVAVNRVGHEKDPSQTTSGITFWGTSFVAGQQGEILYKAPVDEEATAVVDIPLYRTETVRQAWPFLRDRRIDAYDTLSRRLLTPTPTP